MAARTGDYPIGLGPLPFWRWLLLALLLHGLLFMEWHRILCKEAELQVASGDNAGEVELEESMTAVPMVAPPPAPGPPPVPAPPQKIEPVIPKSDDFIIPKTAPGPATTPSRLEQPPKIAVTNSSSSTPHQTHPKSDTPQYHHSSARGRVGSAGNGKASCIANPEPPYPEAACDAQIEGTLELLVSVSETGKVTAVRLVKTSGDLSLDQSALYTVRTLWKFHPATKVGVPVSSEVLVPITFRLSE